GLAADVGRGADEPAAEPPAPLVRRDHDDDLVVELAGPLQPDGDGDGVDPGADRDVVVDGLAGEDAAVPRHVLAGDGDPHRERAEAGVDDDLELVHVAVRLVGLDPEPELVRLRLRPEVELARDGVVRVRGDGGRGDGDRLDHAPLYDVGRVDEGAEGAALAAGGAADAAADPRLRAGRRRGH